MKKSHLLIHVINSTDNDLIYLKQMYTSKWGRNQNWAAFDTECSYNPKEVRFAFELFHLWCIFNIVTEVMTNRW